MNEFGNAQCRKIYAVLCFDTGKDVALRYRTWHGDMMKQKLLILTAFAIAVACFFAFGLHHYFSFAWLKTAHHELTAAFAERPLIVAGIFMALQASAMALSIPGSVLGGSLAAGAIFGFGWGVGIALVAVVIGDSVAFLMARYLFRDWVEKRFAKQAAVIQQGFERDGAYYLFAMRLMAVIPFFIVNLTMGLTRMPLTRFAPVSFLGLAPVTAIYVNAGTQLARIESPGDIISLPVLASLGLLGIAPVILRLVMDRFRPAIARDET